jgi:hypothetical protein
MTLQNMQVARDLQSIQRCSRVAVWMLYYLAVDAMIQGCAELLQVRARTDIMRSVYLILSATDQEQCNSLRDATYKKSDSLTNPLKY